MKTLRNLVLLPVCALTLFSCSKNDDTNLTLHFNNTFKDKTIVLGDATSTTATKNISVEGQEHHFSELKYVISNIRLIKADGTEFPYNVNDLDKGATVINQAKPQTLDYVLTNIPVGEYKEIKFGLGVRADLNTADQVRFPRFYAEAGANDTEMMWQWATGYRFTKIEGFYDTDHKPMTIHTGSTLDGKIDDPDNWKQGVDAYRDITLTLPNNAIVGNQTPRITINADLNKLLSGKSHTILITEGKNDVVPGYHSSMEGMLEFVNNVGGNGSSDITGMFSIGSVQN